MLADDPNKVDLIGTFKPDSFERDRFAALISELLTTSFVPVPYLKDGDTTGERRDDKLLS